MIEAILFDLDGVLCSTDEYHYQAWKQVADRLGIYFDREINDRLRGVSRMASLDIVLERAENAFSAEEKAAFAAEKNEIYRALLEQMSPADLPDEVKRTLEELRRRGYRLAVGSSSKNAKFILERIGLGGWFDAVSDGTNITRSKPDPEVFLKAAEYLDIAPERCAIVEDAVAGVQAGLSAGMETNAVGDAVKAHIADHDLGSLEDLLTIYV